MLKLFFLFLGWLVVFGGIFFIFTAVFGILKFPDFFSRVHCASIGDSLGVPLSLMGLACLQNSFLFSIKLFIIAVVILFISPIASNLIIKAAYNKRLAKNPIANDLKNLEVNE